MTGGFIFAITVVLFTRIAIGIASGEIAIRYFAWWLSLRRQKEELLLMPMILGIAIAAATICAIEMLYLLLRSSPDHLSYVDLTAGSVTFEVLRCFLFISACFFVYPLTVIHYRQGIVTAMTEMVVRLFLIAISFVSGYEWNTIYQYLHHGSVH